MERLRAVDWFLHDKCKIDLCCRYCILLDVRKTYDLDALFRGSRSRRQPTWSSLESENTWFRCSVPWFSILKAPGILSDCLICVIDCTYGVICSGKRRHDDEFLHFYFWLQASQLRVIVNFWGVSCGGRTTEKFHIFRFRFSRLSAVILVVFLLAISSLFVFSRSKVAVWNHDPRLIYWNCKLLAVNLDPHSLSVPWA